MSGLAVHWRWSGSALLACGAAVLAALAVPVHLPEVGDSTVASSTLRDDAAEPAPEDLDAFLATSRWGVSLRDIHEAEAATTTQTGEAGGSINPVLAKMGFVGLIVTRDQSAVLLRSPEGPVVRVGPGEALPDGRILVSVTDNSLTLQGDGLPEEVLTLFPRIRTEPPASDSVDDDDGPRAPSR